MLGSGMVAALSKHFSIRLRTNSLSGLTSLAMGLENGSGGTSVSLVLVPFFYYGMTGHSIWHLVCRKKDIYDVKLQMTWEHANKNSRIEFAHWNKMIIVYDKWNWFRNIYKLWSVFFVSPIHSLLLEGHLGFLYITREDVERSTACLYWKFTP